MADTTPPPPNTEFEPSGSLQTTGASFDSAEGGTLSTKTTDASQTIRDSAMKLTQQAGDKARAYAEEGKTKAGGALDEVVRLLNDAAGQVDEKVGAQYSQYARSAASAVSDFSESLKNKNVDDLVGDARELVRKSPAVAIGAAAAIGFVIARLVKAGIDGSQSNDKA